MLVRQDILAITSIIVQNSNLKQFIFLHSRPSQRRLDKLVSVVLLQTRRHRPALLRSRSQFFPGLRAHPLPLLHQPRAQVQRPHLHRPRPRGTSLHTGHDQPVHAPRHLKPLAALATLGGLQQDLRRRLPDAQTPVQLAHLPWLQPGVANLQRTALPDKD